MTSASSIEKPWSSDAVRQGASPIAQSTSATAPQDRQMTWWWLSPTRPSYRAGLAGRFDTPDEARPGQCVEALVHGLKGDMADAVTDPGGDRLDTEVVAVPDGLEQRGSGRRHPQAGTAQLLGRGRSLGCGHAENLSSRTRTIQENDWF